MSNPTLDCPVHVRTVKPSLKFFSHQKKLAATVSVPPDCETILFSFFARSQVQIHSFGISGHRRIFNGILLRLVVGPGDNIIKKDSFGTDFGDLVGRVMIGQLG